MKKQKRKEMAAYINHEIEMLNIIKSRRMTKLLEEKSSIVRDPHLKYLIGQVAAYEDILHRLATGNWSK